MNWHDYHDRRALLRQWARAADGTWYGIYPLAIRQGSSRWSVHRRLAGTKYDVAIGHRRTLAEARACAEADLVERGADV